MTDKLAMYALRWSIAVIVVATFASCVATPMPEPPYLDPLELELVKSEIDPDGLFVTVLFRGQPGAAPARATLWVVNYDSQAPAAETAINADGSFELELSDNFGDLWRLQLRDGTRRSTPQDVRLEDDLSPTPLELDPCLELDPQYEIAFGETIVGEPATLELRVNNRCSESIWVDSADVRLDSTPFERVGFSSAQSILPEGELSIGVAYTPLGPDEDEEILVLGLGAPLDETRAITLFGRGLP